MQYFIKGVYDKYQYDESGIIAPEDNRQAVDFESILPSDATLRVNPMNPHGRQVYMFTADAIQARQIEEKLPACLSVKANDGDFYGDI